MKYPNLEDRTEKKRQKEALKKMLIKEYAESDSFEEFILKATILGCPVKKPFNRFYLHYMFTNTPFKATLAMFLPVIGFNLAMIFCGAVFDIRLLFVASTSVMLPISIFLCMMIRCVEIPRLMSNVNYDLKVLEYDNDAKNWKITSLSSMYIPQSNIVTNSLSSSI